MITKYLMRLALQLGFVSFVAAPAAQVFADEAPPPSDAASAQQLATARKMVQRVLDRWDYETWNQVLAPDVQVDLKLGTITTDSAGLPAALGADIQVKGRDEAKKALKDIYGDLKKDVNVIGQVAYGYDVILFGDLNVVGKDNKPESLPITCYMQFNAEGKIQKLTLASIDTRPLVEAASKAMPQPAPDKQ